MPIEYVSGTMDQSEGSPSMRGILSAGNWKILYSTPGRSIANPHMESAKSGRMACNRLVILISFVPMPFLSPERRPSPRRSVNFMSYRAEVSFDSTTVLEKHKLLQMAPNLAEFAAS